MSTYKAGRRSLNCVASIFNISFAIAAGDMGDAQDPAAILACDGISSELGLGLKIKKFHRVFWRLD